MTLFCVNLFQDKTRYLRCLRSLYLGNSFVIPALHNPLYNSLLNCFFEPILHRSHIYSKDFCLLHGILLGEVRRKHLEELFVGSAYGQFLLESLLHLQDQAFQILTFWMIDIDWMVSRLVQLVQDTHLASHLCCGREDCQTEHILINRL